MHSRRASWRGLVWGNMIQWPGFFRRWVTLLLTCLSLMALARKVHLGSVGPSLVPRKRRFVTLSRPTEKCEPRQSLRRYAAAALFTLMSSTIVPFGCGHSIERMPLHAKEQKALPGIPPMTTQRLQACVDEYGGQLDDQPYRITARVKVNTNHRVTDVFVTGVPERAPDFESCTRVALSDMAIPESLFQLRPDEILGMTDSPAVSTRKEMATPAVVVIGVVYLLGEFAAQYGGYVILFAVSVELVKEASEDVAEALRRRRRWENDCDAQRTECLMSDIADQSGGLFKHTLCHLCRETCVKSGGTWPTEVERFDGTMASCAYWRHRGN